MLYLNDQKESKIFKMKNKTIFIKRSVICVISLGYGFPIFSQLKFKKYEQYSDYMNITMEFVSNKTLVISTDLNCTHCVDYPTHVEIYCEYRIKRKIIRVNGDAYRDDYLSEIDCMKQNVYGSAIHYDRLNFSA